MWGRTNAAKNSGYFPQCSAVVMLKIEAGQYALEREAVARPQQRIRAKKKITSKLRLGLNFAGNVQTLIFYKNH